MKAEILNNQEEQTIDWSKPQWVVSDEFIVFTSGEHTENTFTGTCLPCKSYPKGNKSEDWGKEYFKPIPKEGITVLLKND